MISEQQLVKFFVQKIKEKGNERIALKLNINEIDGVKVKAEVISCLASITFEIEATEIKKHSKPVYFPRKVLFSKFVDRPVNTENPPTEEEIKKAIKKLTETLENLKFNQMENKILSETPQNNFCDPRFIQECSVCLEPTKGRTPCKHSLCYPCWQGIRRKPIEEASVCDRPCPICREPIENTLLPFIESN
jgi:hypothetical protein